MKEATLNVRLKIEELRKRISGVSFEGEGDIRSALHDVREVGLIIAEELMAIMDMMKN